MLLLYIGVVWQHRGRHTTMTTLARPARGALLDKHDTLRAVREKICTLYNVTALCNYMFSAAVYDLLQAGAKTAGPGRLFTGM